jgi:excisionase family DNA binding protein
MAKDRRPSPPPEETADLLMAELRRRGMSEAEIAQALRKKKRKRVIEFNAVKTPHVRWQQDYPKARAPSADLVTVEAAAERLQLHPKTVLRMIRDQRLPAKRIGKAYRIQKKELDAFAGVAEAESPPIELSVTTIVDLAGVEPEPARLWAQRITAALNGRPSNSAALRADVVHEPARRQLKIVIVGGPGDTAGLLELIEVWAGQSG